MPNNGEGSLWIADFFFLNEAEIRVEHEKYFGNLKWVKLVH